MMSKKSPLVRIWNAIGVIATRSTDTTTYTSHRLAAIEDRLAALDGGDDANAARHSAFARSEDARLIRGERPIGFRIGSGDVLEWSAPETRLDSDR